MMMYTVSFVAALIMLNLWSYYKNHAISKTLLPSLLGLSLLVYGSSVIFSSADISDKFLTGFRDLMILGGSSLLFKVFSQKKTTFLPVLLITLVAFAWYNEKWGHNMASSASETIENSTAIPLASDAEILIEIHDNTSPTTLQSILDKYDLSIKRAFFPEDGSITELDDYYTIDVPTKHLANIKEIETVLENSGFIDWLEENEIINISPIPSKLPSEINKKFGLNDAGIEHLWSFEAMEMDKLYRLLEKNKLKPQKKAIIAILDTGVDAEHEDLKANFKSIEKDSNTDPMSHGTHCAGIAGAVSNNQVGIASYSRNNAFTQISSVRVLNKNGAGTQQGIIKGILTAADQGADVISLSLGGPSNRSRQRAYAKAIKYANKKNAIVVAAAGNSNRNAKNYCPANTPGIICVSAVDKELNRAVFSNYVQDVDMGIAAPGVNIYSSVPGNKYATFNGTSMATPYVAGLLGLMKSIQPKLTTAQAYALLHDNGKKTKSTDMTGYFIQPYAVVKAMVE